MTTIVQYPHKVLKSVSLPITKFIEPTLRDIIQDMRTAMQENKGMGLAAPQIGKAIQLFVCELPESAVKDTQVPAIPFQYFINPVVIKISTEYKSFEEGCLSCPTLTVPVIRPIRLTIAYQNIFGKKKQLKANGLLARIILHEMDHLDGICIADLTT